MDDNTWPSPDIREPFGWNRKRTMLPSDEDSGAPPPPEMPDLGSYVGFGRSFDTPEMWRHIARMLAAGQTVRTISLECGLSRTTIWRRLRDNPALREYVKEERARIAFEADARLHGMRREVISGICMAVRHGDMRTIRWLADRLGMLGPDPLNELYGPSLPDHAIRPDLVHEEGQDAITIRIHDSIMAKEQREAEARAAGEAEAAEVTEPEAEDPLAPVDLRNHDDDWWLFGDKGPPGEGG